MKKSISIVLFICMLLAFVLPVSASSITNSISDATIITPDSFFQLFNTDNIDEASYEFEISEEDDKKASVILQTSLTINNQKYNILTEGQIDCYQLNNNDILWEGPLNGSIIINDKVYSVIAGFIRLDSTNESMVSITIQNDTTIVVISLGTNILTGSVRDFFLEETQNCSSNNTNGIMENNTLNLQFDIINPDNSYSTNVVGDQFAPIAHPGTGGTLNLGENGEWEYQSIIVHKHGSSSYKAIKSGVYFDDERNLLLVTLSTFTNETNDYVQSPGWDVSVANLVSFGVELIIEPQPAPNYAYIEFMAVPESIKQAANNSNGVIQYLFPVFTDALNLFNIPTNTISELYRTYLNASRGKIILDTDTGFEMGAQIEKSGSQSFNNLDDLTYGLPFIFQLDRPNGSTYIGNTQYTVSTNLRYRVYKYNHFPMVDTHVPNEVIYYIDFNTTHEGRITLQ